MTTGFDPTRGAQARAEPRLSSEWSAGGVNVSVAEGRVKIATADGDGLVNDFPPEHLADGSEMGRWLVAAAASSADSLTDTDDLEALGGEVLEALNSAESGSERVSMAELYRQFQEAENEVARQQAALADTAIDIADARRRSGVDRQTFSARVTDRRVDLVNIVVNGVPPLDYLPASKGIFVAGTRHLLPAPKKVGKSLSMLAHSIDMVLAGARVAVLDRENGADVYARRLEGVMGYRKLSNEQQETVRANYIYYASPQLRYSDADHDLAAEFTDFDLVIFDSSRMFLTGLGLGEDSSDDYAKFMEALIDPLHAAGVATVVLDNTGHSETKRSRGTSSKGDLHEILFSMSGVNAFDKKTLGKVQLKIEESRHGTGGTWSMKLGAGTFGSWTAASEAEAAGADAPDDDLLQRVSEAVAANPGIGKGALRREVSGGSARIDSATDWLVANLYVSRAISDNGQSHTSLKPYPS